MLGGEMGTANTITAAIGMNTFAYWRADKAVFSVDRARKIDARSSSELYQAVDAPARQANR